MMTIPIARMILIPMARMILMVAGTLKRFRKRGNVVDPRAREKDPENQSKPDLTGIARKRKLSIRSWTRGPESTYAPQRTIVSENK